MEQMLLDTGWWIPCYGLVGAILTIPWMTRLIRRTGPRPAAYLNILMTTIAFIHGTALFQAIWDREPYRIVFNWLTVAGLDLDLTFELSSVSVGAMESVTILSLLAQVFALGYMEKDWALARFFALVGFFEGAMSAVAISDSLLVSYGLLELLTLSTYLLVGFWYAQPLVVKAARDAFLTKRAGDILLFAGVIALSSLAGSLDFNDLYEWCENPNISPLTATLIGLALIAGPIGKCAQFPLHLWLDEAMEGPNPASILRNSVVVTGGAYILIKVHPILYLSPIVTTTLMVVGTVTAIGASLVAIAQIDIKRTISYSTSAYLGLVFIAVGAKWISFAFFLLFAHAVAKGLLFMSVGCVILTTNTQDVNEFGGLGKSMPATTTAFIVGSLAMTGVFPLGGFWAFQEGLEALRIDYPWAIWTILLVNGLTAFNLARVFGLVFLGKTQPKTRRSPEVAWPLALPMVILTVLTLLTPAVMSRLALLPDLDDITALQFSSISLSSVLGFVVGGLLYFRTDRTPVKLSVPWLQELLTYDFYVEKFYDNTVVWVVYQLSQVTAWIDRYIVDGLVNLVGFATIFGSESLKYGASGQVQSYVLTITVGVGLMGLTIAWIFLSL
ncbi:NAD(P)H-quinone oxidoreductase subunit F [Chamaesiphon polymorphus]|uniref:NAD(P)H-quinone oxidoreductase subunit F n=1 Tax=Chamaesiphon polymorphus CCALA 037 TaxID=2107692 RepID=A0A2T1G9A6_9CYAN|nr:NAD(P)H-quinone oxidoreductase subunit F [Chamaesiphon polymorphus]PSB53814.1 NAD(P)H-quinone oxidoreductase subunit F [Chamaesiphon polymorphus CCALA 037]